MLNTGWVRYFDVLLNSSGRNEISARPADLRPAPDASLTSCSAPIAFPPAALTNTLVSARRSMMPTLSSSVTPTVESSIRRRLILASLATSWSAWAAPGAEVEMVSVSKKLLLTIVYGVEGSESRVSLRTCVSECTLAAIRRSPSGPW